MRFRLVLRALKVLLPERARNVILPFMEQKKLGVGKKHI